MSKILTMSYSHWRNNPRLVRALIEKSVDIVQWLEAKGLKFEWDDSIQPVLVYRISSSWRGGASVIKTMKLPAASGGVSRGIAP